MDSKWTAVARDCLDAALRGTSSFPEIVRRLMEAGFEGYAVDYRRDTQTAYHGGGGSVLMQMPPMPGSVAASFDAVGVGRLVRWAQANGPDYSYQAFSEKVKQAGCAGYLVSFPGRRVLYFGRTAESHLEHFPGQA